MSTPPPSFPPPSRMNPRDMCIALLEARRILADVWIHAPSDYDREEIETALIPIRSLIKRLCKDHGLPLD